MAYMRLGELMRSVGLITDEQLDHALEVQKTTHKRLGDVLIDEKIISEKQLIEALQMQLGVDFIDLTTEHIPAELASVLPESIAKRHSVVPIKIVKDELILAMADPLDYVAIEEVKAASCKRIVPMIATADAIDRAIAMLYGGRDAARAIEEMRSEKFGRKGKKQTAETVDKKVQSAPTVRLVNAMIERAATERASDIHLEPRTCDMNVRMRIDGLLSPFMTVPCELQDLVISRIKIMGGMDTSERRVPQDGRANFRVNGSNIDLRISTLPTVYGEKAVIRLFDKSNQLLDASAIGLEGDSLRRCQALLENANGMVLIVGPAGSGKTSTMYTMLRSLNSPEVNIVTLEDPVEYDIDGVNQAAINEKTGMTFAKGLRAVLRQDPDIIAVGEIRDGETAEIAMRSAITGHLVLSTLHTSDTVSALDRLLDIGVEPYIIAEALNGIISQRLVRKICPECMESYTPDEGELEKLGMAGQGNVTFYRGRGCAHCRNTGYIGRTGVFEILMFDRKLKRAVAEGRHRADITEYLNGEHYISFAECARRLVLEGVTSSSEAIRILRSTVD